MLLVASDRTAAAPKIMPAEILITVQASRQAAFVSELRIESRELTQALIKAAKDNVSAPPLIPDVDILIRQDGTQSAYRLEPSGNLWNETTSVRLALPKEASEKLLKLAKGLRDRHYGRLIAWDDAEGLIPRKSIFTVTDIDSGLTFRVQRRAGSDHADVQPVTKEDTRIMKHIYRDKWSWKRKAVLVHAEGKWIAASMNGMPHGGDGIPGNGFSGHFCIHFYLSSTHKSDQPDLAHQLMVHKAAGDLQPYFDAASPVVLAKTAVVVMNHQDPELLSQLAEGLPKEELDRFVLEMEQLSSIQEQRRKREGNGSNGADEQEPVGESLSAKVTVPVTMESRNGSQHNTRCHFQFKRESVQSPWRFEQARLGE
ncbi:hypothetical protein [Paenibacillus harenae]|uniref:hypothetical protein n=1 Tax=Paenibacillus harenae TaxID=306543 RepID=UPI0004173039|nr:hypothetical protein [Paenibacillus harenae]